MPMIVLQTKTGLCPADNPGSTAVLADRERNANLARLTITHMHEQALADEWIICRRRWLIGDDFPFERFST
jgi:hypothetical protein